MNHLSAVKPVAGKSYMNAGSELQQMGGVQTSTTSNQSKLEEGFKDQGLKFKVPGSIESYNLFATINFKL